MSDLQDAAYGSARPVVVEPARDPAAESPLSEAQFALLRQAAAARRPIRNAAKTARVSAITIFIVGVSALPFTLVLFDPFTLLVVAGVCAIGVLEWIGAGKMRRGEVSAAAFLGRNQLIFLALIIVYCVGQMIQLSSSDVGAMLGAGDASDAAALGQAGIDVQGLTGLVQAGMYLVYGLVILLSVGFQGGLALYYFTRKSRLQALARHEPAWIRRLFSEVGV